MDLANAPECLGMPERVRRSQGRLARNSIASAKVTRSERAELEAAAKREGKALSEWAREALLEKARCSQTDTTLFTELIALRMLMSTVLRSVALGERLSPQAYAQVLADVRANKHETARDVLTQYQTQSGGR